MSEWIIVALVGVVLLFSAKKLPDMARGLGQSMRIFKAETRGLKEDDERGAPRPVEGSAPPSSTPAASSDETPAPVHGATPDGSRLRE